MVNEANAEQLNKTEKGPLKQRVTEFLTTFAQEKANEPVPKGQEGLKIGQIARCYRLAASVSEGKINDPDVFTGVKKYATEYHLALSKKRQQAQETVTKNPTKKTYEDLERTDPQTLDALLAKAEFLNKRGSLHDPTKETDLAKRRKIESDQLFTAKTFGSKLARPVGELRDLYVYSRQKRRLDQLDGQLKTMGETLEELGKIVPKKATP